MNFSTYYHAQWQDSFFVKALVTDNGIEIRLTMGSVQPPDAPSTKSFLLSSSLLIGISSCPSSKFGMISPYHTKLVNRPKSKGYLVPKMLSKKPSYNIRAILKPAKVRSPTPAMVKKYGASATIQAVHIVMRPGSSVIGTSSLTASC